MSYQTLITPQALADHYQEGSWRIFDCRHALSDVDKGRRDYAEAHLPNALFVHLDEDLSGPIIPGVTGRHPLPEPEAFIARLCAWGVDNNTQCVVYDDMAGAIAARLWWMLRWMGHDRVAVLEGGLPRWLKEGRPTTAEVPVVTPTNFQANPKPHMVQNVDEVIAALHRGEVLADARGADRYRGDVEPIDPVAGHIPGAINLPFTENLTSEGNFREDLSERFAALAQTPVTFYCGSGVTAAHNILAMTHLGLDHAKMYPGSWSHWICDKTRPTAKTE